MRSDHVYHILETRGLLAGMRGDFPPETALRIVEVLVEEGIVVFEFTMNSTDPLQTLQSVKRAFGDDVCAGMGTVLDATTARQVIDAGADLIMSPAFGPEVVQAALDADVLIAPGVITPTECVNAWAMGVRLLKIFPIGPLGLDYFKSIRGPLNHMRFLANGGITAENAGDYLRAGATCCGLSGWLTGDGTWPLETIRKRARQVVQAVAAARDATISSNIV
ncbi:MAG TPA: bifunctional 4-hydroxy-2-oxoglutarate aldolase/2-dehydro-3-deoxy-phosphogluconate aldolase [Spirillospora sp.]|nr:bifunctional 4-hydroxy-2-oxoglutarate aldolase/2-dehydro-3-deoxy-phosphogluconate aldolase [Spirillospora sp.]